MDDRQCGSSTPKTKFSGCRSSVDRSHGVREVRGSIPRTPTKIRCERSESRILRDNASECWRYANSRRPDQNRNMARSTKQASQGGPHLDCWHYLDYRDGKHDKYFAEWKYFNFTQPGLAGYIVYYILSPEKQTSISGGRLLIRAFKNNASFGSIKRIPVDRIQCDNVSADIIMDGAEIVEKNPYLYEIRGNIDDISWTLDYQQKTPTIEGFQNLNAGFLRWERANWLVEMPGAKVSGEIRKGKEVFRINGLGYTDTNWGEMIPLSSRWEWGQCNDEKLSFTFGMLYGIRKIKKAYFFFSAGNRTMALEDTQCHVEHTEWVKDKNTGLRMPSRSSFTFRDKDYVVRFSSRLIQNDILGLKFSSLLPKVVVSEQLVQYRGAIEKNGVPIHKFEETGFREWTTRTWKNVPLLF